MKLGISSHHVFIDFLEQALKHALFCKVRSNFFYFHFMFSLLFLLFQLLYFWTVEVRLESSGMEFLCICIRMSGYAAPIQITTCRIDWLVCGRLHAVQQPSAPRRRFSFRFISVTSAISLVFRSLFCAEWVSCLRSNNPKSSDIPDWTGFPLVDSPIFLVLLWPLADFLILHRKSFFQGNFHFFPTIPSFKVSFIKWRCVVFSFHSHVRRYIHYLSFIKSMSSQFFPMNWSWLIARWSHCHEPDFYSFEIVAASRQFHVVQCSAESAVVTKHHPLWHWQVPPFVRYSE